MALPEISLYNEIGDEKISNWMTGTVKAGTASNELVVYVWNNKGGVSDVSDMIECNVSVLDKNGRAIDNIVSDAVPWVKVNVNDSPTISNDGNIVMETVDGNVVPKKAFHAIGGNKTFPIWKKSADPRTFVGYNATDPNRNYYGYCDSDQRITCHTISGKVNSIINQEENYAKCTFKVEVPLNTPTGNVGAKIRFQGYYV